MREHDAGWVSPASPGPVFSGSPGGETTDLSHPHPQIPDHEPLRPIGRGAYGQVWLARNVMGSLRAVKVLHRRDFGDSHPFEREYKGIQKFEPISRSHPGVVNVLQVGRNDTEGYFYYVMELADDAGNPKSEAQSPKAVQNRTAEGMDEAGQVRSADLYAPRTLRSELKLRGRLPFDECLQVGLALSGALEHLHQHGLVHRDVKPSNIIFVDGQPKLADIGLVAGVDEARSFVGTEGYIAPEGPGKPQADLYSLGIVLYVMSTGKHHDAFPEPLTDLVSEPDGKGWLELTVVIHKACQVDPRERYHTAGEMHADLLHLQAGKSVRRRQTARWMAERIKRAWPIVALAALLALGGPWAMRRQPPGPMVGQAEKASIFVLPFRSEGSNGVPDDLRARITDAFIDSLALIDGVRRSPRKSGWAHQDEIMLCQSLAKTNDMRHILTERITSSGDGLTLTLRLSKRGEAEPVWSESFSGTTNQVIVMEQRALTRMTQVLGLKITEGEQQKIDVLLTNNLEALELLRRACVTYQNKAGTQRGYTEVQTLAQKALEVDPRYLDAEHMMLYQTRVLSMDRPPVEVWPSVFRGMSHILEADDTYASAIEQLAGYILFYKRDWSGTDELNRRELQCRSGGDAQFVRAFWYRIHGWLEEARMAQQMSEEPEPTDIDQRMCMAAARWVDRRFAEGTQIARRTLELHPDVADGYCYLAHCLVAGGEFESGLEAIDRAQRDWRRPEMMALKGYAYARMGQTNEAHAVLSELMNIQQTGPYLQPYFVARVYAALGEKAKALGWLEKAEADRSEYLFFADFAGLRTDPAWDGLQVEPRYWQLCERLGLGKNQWPRPKPERMP